VAQCIWWLASVLGLQEGLIVHINTLAEGIPEKLRQDQMDPEELLNDQQAATSKELMVTNNPEALRRLLVDCERVLQESRQFQRIAILKATRRTKLGLINPLKSTKNVLRSSREDNIKTEGIEAEEIFRRMSIRESLHCAWPADWKETDMVNDCVRPIKLDKGTAVYPQAKGHFAEKIIESQSGGNDSSDYKDC